MHLIWLSAVVPGMLFVVWAYPESRQRKIWGFCLMLAMLGITGIVLLDLFSSVGSTAKHGALLGPMFAVLTATDLPVVAMALGSAINWFVSGKNPAHKPVRRSPAEDVAQAV